MDSLAELVFRPENNNACTLQSHSLHIRKQTICLFQVHVALRKCRRREACLRKCQSNVVYSTEISFAQQLTNDLRCRNNICEHFLCHDKVSCWVSTPPNLRYINYNFAKSHSLSGVQYHVFIYNKEKLWLQINGCS